MNYNIPKKNQLHLKKKNIYITSNITENTIWYSKYNYILMNEIYVMNNSTLTIEPGTTIYANSLELSNLSSIPALIVKNDSKLISNGKKDKPIIFTTIVSLKDIFATDIYTNKYTYNNGLGPFGEFWNGITISGTNKTNNGISSKTGIYNVPYGGVNENSYNFELSYTYIYFAGITRLETNSLTLGAPSFYDKIHHCEILFGQNSNLIIYGGSLVIEKCIFGFTYSVGCLNVFDGGQVYFNKNIIIEGLDNINSDYLNDVAFNNLITTSTLLEDVNVLNRRTILFMNNNTLLSLTYTTNYVTIFDESRVYSVNNLFIGNCLNVFNLLNITNLSSSSLVISSTAPTTFNDNYIYIGPSTYQHTNGLYYAGPSITINIPNESSKTVKHIEFLFYGNNQDKLIKGHFLNIIPIETSDVYHNSTSNNDFENNHLLPIIPSVYWSLLPSSMDYERLKTPYYASGVIQKASDIKEWNYGYFNHLLTKDISSNNTPYYWFSFIKYKKYSSDSSSSESSSSESSSSESSSSESSSSESSSSESSSESSHDSFVYKRRSKKGKKEYKVKSEDKKSKKEEKSKKVNEVKKNKKEKNRKESSSNKIMDYVKNIDPKTMLLSNLLLMTSMSILNDSDDE